MYANDTYGFCEDAGSYNLRFYGYLNTIDSITANGYATVFKPAAPSYTGANSDVAAYYYNGYFGYNPNYFVIVVDNDADETAIEADDLFAETYSTTSRTTESVASYDKILKATGTLAIGQKKVALYVNTSYFTEGLEIYYVGQNTTAPALPIVNNEIDLNYNLFNGIGYAAADRKEAVGGVNSYGDIIWGTQPSQVRRGDKLTGELAYCNTIISGDAYNVLRDGGIKTDYTCGELLYGSDKNKVNTNMIGYVPIVRNSNLLSVVSQTMESPNKNYETRNYDVTFYPGALRIEEDDTKPVVEVNKKDVYIEANAIGTYLYECVGQQKTTTYVNCGDGISIIGKNELTAADAGDPILKWLNSSFNYESKLSTADKANNAKRNAAIIKVDLPLISGCESNEHECTSSAYFELMNGKGNAQFATNGGILAGEEEDFVYPFVMQKDQYIKSAGPSNLKELIITLANWFGVTAYDQGEIRNGETLDKKFDKYWYIVIEENGTNGVFDISRVGDYKVHFYVMDNAGNVSDGNMYEEIDGKKTLQTAYKNVGTLHIIDTTAPIVGTVNLYNGRVKCTEADCTLEENWIVAENTYLPINTLLRYDSEGNPSGNGVYVDVGRGALVDIGTLTKYSRTIDNVGASTYTEDSSQGKYILITAGSNASALKHYSWSNSTTGIYLTITGGSDNSYSETLFPTKNVKDNSQWNHYYSRDGGITWFLYDRTKGESYLALDSEGSREILIKAVDSGVKLQSATAATVSYTDKYYGEGNGSNTTKTMNTYTFVDTSQYDTYIKSFNEMTAEEQKTNDANRNTALANIGWNISVASENDLTMADKISKLIYGIPSFSDVGSASGYKFYKDKRVAYLDRTSPVISFGEFNGEKLYVYEFGCSFCTESYEENYAGAIDSYPENYSSLEVQATNFNKNYSILINHFLYDSTKGQEGTLYQPSYADVSQEKPGVKNENGGLGSDIYGMNGLKNGLDIRSVYTQDRRYIIYEFGKRTAGAANETRVMYDLSDSIPTNIDENSDDYKAAEQSIYNVIKDPETYNNLGLGDYTYTIIYSVFDKAGNESVYISRGVIYANLVPTINAYNNGEALEEVEQNSYSLRVEQGADVNEIAESLAIDAGNRTQFLTQTIYYNGELVVDNKKYKEGIYDGFTTSVPGVYEITYNLRYMYHGSDGRSEIIEAAPIKLTITVEATPPIVETSKAVDSSYVIVGITILISTLALCWFGLISKKRN
jgi:hypothetical protein